MTELRRSVRDTLVAFGAVAVILGGLWLYTGVWPPMVVVESGSMMHPTRDLPFGRLGTIDPGDLVLVKSVERRSDLATWAENGDTRYGSPGDVLVYFPSGDRTRTPVIHRAITWVEVTGSGNARTYSFAWSAPTESPACRSGVCTFGDRGIFFPDLGFDNEEGRPFTQLSGWKPPASGFVTKGDNPNTNAIADQASGISCPQRGLAPTPRPGCGAVEMEWIEGHARGEVPWFGLLKLALGGRPNMDPQGADWWTIGWATAPRDLWIMMLGSVGLLISVPLALDLVRRRDEEPR